MDEIELRKKANRLIGAKVETPIKSKDGELLILYSELELTEEEKGVFAEFTVKELRLWLLMEGFKVKKL